MIKLPACCDRPAAIALLPEFVAAMNGATIEIDASAVTRLGQAFLQILVGARQTGKGEILNASPALIETARLTGLEHVLFDRPAK
ncbi:MAG: STAS domain-containing protein [Novosphingobium sp.]